jgi:hypothetical protein
MDISNKLIIFIILFGIVSIIGVIVKDYNNNSIAVEKIEKKQYKINNDIKKTNNNKINNNRLSIQKIANPAYKITPNKNFRRY